MEARVRSPAATTFPCGFTATAQATLWPGPADLTPPELGSPGAVELEDGEVTELLIAVVDDAGGDHVVVPVDGDIQR